MSLLLRAFVLFRGRSNRLIPHADSSLYPTRFLPRFSKWVFCGVGVCTRTQIHGLLVTASSVNHDSGTFQVEKVDGRRILRVRFQPRIQHALIPIAAVWSSLI